MFHHLMVEKPWLFHHLWRISHSIEGSPAISSKVKTMLEEHQASMPPQAPCELHGHFFFMIAISMDYWCVSHCGTAKGNSARFHYNIYIYNIYIYTYIYIYILCVCIYIYIYTYVHLYSHFVHMIRLRSYLHSDDLGQVAPPSVKVSDAEAESKDQPWSWHGDIAGSSINGRQLNN